VDKPVKQAVKGTVEVILGKKIEITDSQWEEIRQSTMNHIYHNKLQFFKDVSKEYFLETMVEMALMQFRNSYKLQSVIGWFVAQKLF
jgi:hypothetical protein